MRNSLFISLEELNQAYFKDLFILLDQAFGALNINYYVLGALARDVWYALENKQTRATRDVDLAIYVDSQGHYNEVLHTLVAEYDFKIVEDAPIELHTPFGYAMDLIPFGTESNRIKERFNDNHDLPIYFEGIKEVFNHATVNTIDEKTGIEMNIASLPGILLLKLIAYDDRPEKERKTRMISKKLFSTILISRITTFGMNTTIYLLKIIKI